MLHTPPGVNNAWGFAPMVVADAPSLSPGTSATSWQVDCWG